VAAVLFAALLAMGADSAPGTEPAKVLEEGWYALYINGQKSGYTHERVLERQAPEGPQYDTRLDQEIVLGRGSVVMRTVVDTRVREDARGRLVAFRQATEGAISLLMEGKVEDGQLVVRTKGPTGEDTARLPVPEGLCPQALRRLHREKAREPGAAFTAVAFLPTAPGQGAEIRATVIGREEVEVFDVRRALVRTDETVSILPNVLSSEWTDDAGTVWLTRAVLPGNLVMESRKTSKEMALAKDAPAQILTASYLMTDKPIPHPRTLERLTAVFRVPQSAAAPAGVESDAFQQVQPEKDGWRVTIRRAHPAASAAYALPYAGDEHARLLEPSIWLETKAPEVVKMAQEAVGGEKDALKAARRIEAYVHAVISDKGLGVGFASAAETAVQKTGDCTEHAVLAAALARAVGMPSRVVAGLVYAEKLPASEAGGFGFHMWTEVFVGEWLPIDAAMGSHDATHLALVRSSLDGPDDMLQLVSAICGPFMGGTVEVIEAQ
jgi:hypothetical protein